MLFSNILAMTQQSILTNHPTCNMQEMPLLMTCASTGLWPRSTHVCSPASASRSRQNKFSDFAPVVENAPVSRTGSEIICEEYIGVENRVFLIKQGIVKRITKK